MWTLLGPGMNMRMDLEISTLSFGWDYEVFTVSLQEIMLIWWSTFDKRTVMEWLGSITNLRSMALIKSTSYTLERQRAHLMAMMQWLYIMECHSVRMIMTMIIQMSTVHNNIREVGGTMVVITVISPVPTLIIKYGNVSCGMMALLQELSLPLITTTMLIWRYGQNHAHRITVIVILETEPTYDKRVLRSIEIIMVHAKILNNNMLSLVYTYLLCLL